MIFIFGLVPVAFAQQHTVTGTIKDDAGEPIWGATVMVEGSTVGAMTDENGKYSIEAPADAVLSYSFIGFAGQQIPVGGRAVIDVVLKMDSETLDDVIVVAFGTTKKEAFTGSATTVKSEDITKSQQSNIAQSLAGKVAGVQLSNTSVDCGRNALFRRPQQPQPERCRVHDSPQGRGFQCSLRCPRCQWSRDDYHQESP